MSLLVILSTISAHRPCSAGQHYMEEASACPNTCQSPVTECDISLGEGCDCDPGIILLIIYFVLFHGGYLIKAFWLINITNICKHMYQDKIWRRWVHPVGPLSLLRLLNLFTFTILELTWMSAKCKHLWSNPVVLQQEKCGWKQNQRVWKEKSVLAIMVGSSAYPQTSGPYSVIIGRCWVKMIL